MMVFRLCTAMLSVEKDIIHITSNKYLFSGLTHTESTLKLLGNAQIQVRHKFHEKQYLTLSGNYAIHQNQFSNFLQGKKIYGTSIGYGYDSPLGPIEGFICYSNRTNKLGFYLNIGFGF